MNCPCHVQVYNQGLKSYRDLPLRLAEFGSCHRYESSGSMHGLMRVRGFTQDDAHIFCTEDQIEGECAGFIQLLSSVYKDLGFDSFEIKLSTRPEVRIGTRCAVGHRRRRADECDRKAGPSLRDQPRRRCLLRAEAGLQADRRHRPPVAVRHLPGRLRNCPTGWARNMSARTAPSTCPTCCTAPSLAALNASSASFWKTTPGNCPSGWPRGRLWSPPSSRTPIRSCMRSWPRCVKAGVRAEADTRNEKINYKVREHSVGKVPVILAIGMQEVEARTVSVRRLGEARTETISLDAAVATFGFEALPPA